MLSLKDFISVSDILRKGASTFEERNKTYGENYMRVGAVMAALFPEGVALKSDTEFLVWHIFELMVVKMTRLATSDLTHEDSAHDMMVYAAMLEKLIKDIKNGTL